MAAPPYQTRLVHLLSTGRAKPWSVLAVTFIKKAAREMRERVEALLGPGGAEASHVEDL